MFSLVLSLTLYLILNAQSGRAFSKACVYLPWSCALDWVFISMSYTVCHLWQGTVVNLILKSPPLHCLLDFYQPICLWYLLSVNSGLKRNKRTFCFYFFLIIYYVYTSPGFFLQFSFSILLLITKILIQIGKTFPVSCRVSCFVHGHSHWTTGSYHHLYVLLQPVCFPITLPIQEKFMLLHSPEVHRKWHIKEATNSPAILDRRPGSTVLTSVLITSSDLRRVIWIIQASAFSSV